MVTDSRKLSRVRAQGKFAGKRHHPSLPGVSAGQSVTPPQWPACPLHPVPRPGRCWTCDEIAAGRHPVTVPPARLAAVPDVRPPCQTCGQRMGRADAVHGVCVGCRRVAERGAAS